MSSPHTPAPEEASAPDAAAVEPALDPDETYLAPPPLKLYDLDGLLFAEEGNLLSRFLLAIPAAAAFWGNALFRLSRLHAVLAVLFVAVYASTFVFMGKRWWGDPAAQHGWLVIPIALLVSAARYDRLKSIPVRPHPGGLWVMGGALALHFFEKAVDLNGPSPLSIPIFVAGAVWHFLGTSFLKELAFPIAYLCFMIPIPGGFTEVVSFPLRMLATTGSKAIARFFGVDVYGSGMNLEFLQPRGYEFIRLEVADPCSGLHSLMAIKALHAITAYLTKLKLGWKWVLFMCAIPIALAANLTRITLIILIGAYIDKKFAETVFHEYSSPVLFVIAFAILIGIGRFMEWATGALKAEKAAKAAKDGEGKAQTPAATAAA